MSGDAVIFMVLAILILGGGLIISSINLRNVIRAQKRRELESSEAADGHDQS